MGLEADRCHTYHQYNDAVVTLPALANVFHVMSKITMAILELELNMAVEELLPNLITITLTPTLT